MVSKKIIYSLMRKLIKYVLPLLFMTIQLLSQPTLNIDHIWVYWSMIELDVTPRCNGNVHYGLSKDNFSVKENGEPLNDFEVNCSEINIHCCISISLVIDRSAGMNQGNPSGLDLAKASANSFISAMNGNCDEATIISFDTHLFFDPQIIVDVFMTNDTTLLKQGVDSLHVSGTSAIWDAAITGIDEIINNGTQECRAVIVLTNGKDSASTNTIDNIISLALANKVRVFTIGFGNNINDTDLSRIAGDTGGRYYKNPQPSQLIGVYKEISTLLGREPPYCYIIYTSKCMDGTRRNVELTLQNLLGCSGTDTKTKSYKTPKDTSTLASIVLHPQNQNAHEGDSVTFSVTTLRATHFQWFKDSTIISGATNSTLTIAPVKKNDEGNYSVIVSSDCRDTIISSSARLNIITTDVQENILPPASFYLGQNYPNPFIQSTIVDLTSPQRVFDPALSYEERVTEGRVRSFKVYDVFGREVLNLSNEIMHQTDIQHSKIVIRNSDLPTQGIYFYRLTIGDESQTKMMMFVK